MLVASDRMLLWLLIPFQILPFPFSPDEGWTCRNQGCGSSSRYAASNGCGGSGNPCCQSQSDCCSGGVRCIRDSAQSRRGNGRYPDCTAPSLPADFVVHRGRTQLQHNLPAAHRIVSGIQLEETRLEPINGCHMLPFSHWSLCLWASLHLILLIVGRNHYLVICYYKLNVPSPPMSVEHWSLPSFIRRSNGCCCCCYCWSVAIFLSPRTVRNNSHPPFSSSMILIDRVKICECHSRVQVLLGGWQRWHSRHCNMYGTLQLWIMITHKTNTIHSNVRMYVCVYR